MKKNMFFLLAVVSVAAFSCKRTDEVDPVSQAVAQPTDSLKIQNTYLIPTVIAGSRDHTGAANGTGTSARFNKPLGIFTKSDGSLLVADCNNHAIRKISTGNVVSTPYHLVNQPSDVAAINDGAVGVVTFQNHSTAIADVVIFNHGTHVTRSMYCPLCAFVNIDKDPSNTFFWYGYISEDVVGALFSINESLGHPLPAITPPILEPANMRAFSVAANGNKFLTTDEQVFEYTHSGVLYPIISGNYLNGTIIANHDGSKLYVTDYYGNISLITRKCLTCKPWFGTVIVKGEGAYGLALSNNEKTLYFTSDVHNTVNKVALP